MRLERLKRRLLRNRAGRIAYRLYGSLDRSHALAAASAMAFDAFLSLVPIAALAGWVLDRLHRGNEVFGPVVGPVLEAAPGPVAILVRAEFFRLGESNILALAPVSVFIFLWVTSSGLSTAMYVLEAMYATSPRPWYVRRLAACGYVLFSAVIISLASAAGYFVVTHLPPLLSRVVAFVLPFVVLVGLLSLFFRTAIARTGAPRRRVLPGAIVTVVLWAVHSALFSYYVARLSRYTTLYGNLATVAIFLFWLWLLSLATLVGGEVNAELEGVSPQVPIPPPSLPP